MGRLDLLKYSFAAIWQQRLRSGLTALGIAVGIGAVVLLTSLGTGVQRYVLGEFTQFGTNLLAINPGKTSTAGISGAMISTVQPLTLDDASALTRLRYVEGVVPVIEGNADIEYAERGRRATVFGVSGDLPSVWRISVAQGRFLPDDNPSNARAFAVLGHKVYRELFGDGNALGQRIRVGGERYRVIGVMVPKGQLLGYDLDDCVYLPVGRALALFNREGLMEIDVSYRLGLPSEIIAERVRSTLIARHGKADFTITTQDQMLAALGSVLGALTLAVAGLGAISLVVGAVGILTVMTIAVTERTAEIGLLRAVGADRQHVLAVFLTEAVVLAAVGGIVGLLLGIGVAGLVGVMLPALPVRPAWGYAVLAELSAFLIGVLAGVLPARRAARLDPIDALRGE